MKKEHYVMERKKKSLLVFAFLLSLIILCVPISALDTLATHDSSITIYYNYPVLMQCMLIHNSTNWLGVQRVDFVGTAYPNGGLWASGALTGSQSTSLTLYSNGISQGVHGTATVEWDIENNAALDGTFSVKNIVWDITGHEAEPYLSMYFDDYYGIEGFSGATTSTNEYEYELGSIAPSTWQMPFIGHYISYGNVNASANTPVCSFSAYPNFGTSPLSVALTDISTNTPTSWNWIIKNNSTGYTEEIDSTLQNFVATLYNPDWFDVKLTASNIYGSCSNFSPKHIAVTGGEISKVNLYAVDVTNGHNIAGAHVGIYNVTSNEWYNTTASSGWKAFDYTIGVGGTQYPLSIGQQIMLAAWADGYKDASINEYPEGYWNGILSENYQTVIINLMPTTVVNATGTGHLIVHVVKDKTGESFNGATVTAGINTKSTDVAGNTIFYNLTPGSISVTASDVWYQPQTKYVTIEAGKTISTNFSLVMLGETPVPTTAVPTQSPTGAGATPIPTYTNAAGTAISAPEGSALDAIAQIAAALGGWVKIAIYAISIWLLWILVYEITGGKVIDKIMKRGRGGRKH